MELYELLLVIAAAAAIIILLIVLFVVKKTKTIRKAPKQKLEFKEIVNLFGENNVINIERTEKRVRIEVKDLNTVDLEGLKPFTNGVFTIGNKVVVTFKENEEETYKSLKELIK